VDSNDQPETYVSENTVQMTAGVIIELCQYNKRRVALLIINYFNDTLIATQPTTLQAVGGSTFGGFTALNAGQAPWSRKLHGAFVQSQWFGLAQTPTLITVIEVLEK